jgi:hypothetical protein
MSDLLYPKAKGAILGLSGNGGPIDFDADPLYILLVTNTYVGIALATLKTHQFRSSITGEVSGTGYTAGGIQLTGITLTQSGDNYVFDATDPSWATSTFTARGAVIFKRVGADLTTPADDPLICLLDIGADVTATAGTFSVVFNASGIIQLA